MLRRIFDIKVFMACFMLLHRKWMQLIADNSGILVYFCKEILKTNQVLCQAGTSSSGQSEAHSALSLRCMMRKKFKLAGNATAKTCTVPGLLGCILHSIGYSGSGQPIIKNTSMEKSCQKQRLAKTVRSYLNLLAPTRKPSLPEKPNKKLNTDTQKKPNPRSMATQRSPVYKPTSALGLETILQD